MKLTYIFHSGFLVEGDNFFLLIDFFMDTEGLTSGRVHDWLLKQEKPLYVLSSHFHADHFNPEILTWKERKKNITYIFSKDILKRKRANAGDAVYLKKGDVYEDDTLFVKAFGSTDVGVSFFIKAGGKTIFHAGDLNNWHWKDESTDEEVRQAENHYLRELELVAKEVHQLDVAMFPVDARMGSEYAKGAEQFMEAIPVSLFVPMHFEPDFKHEAQIFRVFAEQKGIRYFMITNRGDSIQF